MPGCTSTGRLAHFLQKDFIMNPITTTTIIIIIPSDLFGINCATGMSALMRKELLDARGGFEAFSCYLAEDFFFAQAVQV